MSSIVGYIGKRLSRAIIFDALKRLEYRGYDCSGFSCLSSQNNRILYAKVSDKVLELDKKCKNSYIDGNIGLGHLRLATQGALTEENTPPQFDCNKSIAVAHNGIIENNYLLRQQLAQTGHAFLSSVDSEIIAHLFAESLKSHRTLNAALINTIGKLEGAYSFVAFLQEQPDCLVAVRKSSPLYLGIGDDEFMVVSQLQALEGFTDKVAFMPNESFALIKNNNIELFDFSGKPLPVIAQKISHADPDNEKCGYDHYMLKEIYDQKAAIYATQEFLTMMSDNIWDHIGISFEQMKNSERIHLVGSGTSWHAARIARFFFEHIAQIPTQVSLSSEFCFMPLLPEQHTMFLLLSQSGETIDTLSALRMINGIQFPTLGVTNEPSSSLVREADGFLLTQAGHERAAASTKSFTTQLAALYWFAHRLALEKGIIDKVAMENANADLLVAAELLENSIENYKIDIEQRLAKQYAQYTNGIFLGRHITYPFACEAALKLKKTSYLHVECYPAGELKHGPLAVIDERCAVFLFSHQDPSIYKKLLSNAQEIKARNGHIVSFVFEGQNELEALSETAFIIPSTVSLLAPIAMAGLMQFFMYQIAKELNCPIDKPRNITKTCDY